MDHLSDRTRPLVLRLTALAAATAALLLSGCGDSGRQSSERQVLERSNPSDGAANPDAGPGEAPDGGPNGGPNGGPGEGAEPGPPKESEPNGEPKQYTYEVVARYPHDPDAYTQGLLWLDGKLYESTGRKGKSSVRLVDLETGEVLKQRDTDPRLFGEGLAAVGGVFYQLTWTAGQALLYDIKTLRPLSYSYSYPGEGWGLTTCDEGLVFSSGSNEIRFLDPKGLAEIRRISVTDRGRSVIKLNELEWIDGEIWANVWQTDRIARIDPVTGKVNGWVDLRGLLGDVRVPNPIEDVLNGIAYDEEGKRLFVTGKHWPYLYQIEVRLK